VDRDVVRLEEKVPLAIISCPGPSMRSNIAAQ
jgi:hypothetical protein